MWGRGNCVAVRNIPFASEKPQRGKWVARKNPITGCTEFVPLHDTTPVELHYVQDDTIPPTFNHVDCKVYESKSAMRAVYKREGFIEVAGKPRTRGLKWKAPSVAETMREVVEKLATPSWNEQFQQRKRWRQEHGDE